VPHVTRLPSFLLIGAAKSGTTSFHEYLKQHPEIFVSRRKEPNYFAFQGRSPDFRGPDDEHPRRFRGLEKRLRVAKYQESIVTAEGYQRLFARAGSATAVGESSVSYMFIPEAADRIHEALPQVALLALLRNPVDRAYSKFLQFRREGLEPIADFSAALDAEEERVRRRWSPTWYYRRRGLYFEQLERYYARFDRERILVLLYDDFAPDPAAVMRRTFAFLGVSESFTPDLSRRHNASERSVWIPRSRSLHRLLGGPAEVEAMSAGKRPRSVSGELRRRLVRSNLRRVHWTHPPMDEAVRHRLTGEFREDLLRLQDLIRLDLSRWLEPPSEGAAASGQSAE
jgi:hypothetical protein